MENQLVSQDKFLDYNGTKVVSSRTIAEIFEKEHKNVLRDIKNYIQKLNKGSNLSVSINQYFIESVYNDSQNRQRLEYLLTRKGFECVTLGYSGDKAFEFKIKFIETFHYYEQLIKEQLEHDLNVFVNNNGTVSASVAMNKIGGSPQALYKILEAHNIIYRTEIVKGNRKHKPIRIKATHYNLINKEFKLSMDMNKLTQLRVTSLGEIWIRNFLTKYGYIKNGMFDMKNYKDIVFKNTGKVI